MIALSLKRRDRLKAVEVPYREGHRFPHLEPVAGERLRLDEIYMARRCGVGGGS